MNKYIKQILKNKQYRYNMDRHMQREPHNTIEKTKLKSSDMYMEHNETNK